MNGKRRERSLSSIVGIARHDSPVLWQEAGRHVETRTHQEGANRASGYNVRGHRGFGSISPNPFNLLRGVRVRRYQLNRSHDRTNELDA
jgi:hypothetical protein